MRFLPLSRARMLKRLVASCAVVCALTVAAPARASVFPFLQPPERLERAGGQVVALDFNGDGWVDVAGVQRVPDKASLVLNGEDGFGEPQTTEIDDGSRSFAASAAAGDLDGDGRDELIATTGERGSLVIFKGRASGGLGTPEVLSLRAWADSRRTLLGVADLDGDGDLDVVAAYGESATVLVNDGDGALTPSAGAVTLPSYLSELKLVKLAGDADPDLVVIGGYALTVLPGAAGAGFGTPVNHPIDAQGAALAASDVNRDGRPDLSVVYDSLQWGAPPRESSWERPTAAWRRCREVRRSAARWCSPSSMATARRTDTGRLQVRVRPWCGDWWVAGTGRERAGVLGERPRDRGLRPRRQAGRRERDELSASDPHPLLVGAAARPG